MLKDYPSQLDSYMFQAFCNASQSKALRRKTGAIVLKEISPGYFQPLSSGCNGTRPGMSNWCEDPRGKSYVDQVVHAERNCLKKMQQEGIPTKGCIVVVTFVPCNECCYDLIDAGIKEVYYCEQSTSCGDKTTKNVETMQRHSMYVKHVPKSRMQAFSNDMRVGLIQDKFMGQDVCSEYLALEKYVTETVDITHVVTWSKHFGLDQQDSPVASFLDFFVDEYEKHRDTTATKNIVDMKTYLKRLLAEIGSEDGY